MLSTSTASVASRDARWLFGRCEGGVLGDDGRACARSGRSSGSMTSMLRRPGNRSSGSRPAFCFQFHAGTLSLVSELPHRGLTGTGDISQLARHIAATRSDTRISVELARTFGLEGGRVCAESCILSGVRSGLDSETLSGAIALESRPSGRCQIEHAERLYALACRRHDRRKGTMSINQMVSS